MPKNKWGYSINDNALVKDSLLMRCCMLHRGVGATAAANISGYSAAARESWDSSEVGTLCHFWSRKGVWMCIRVSMT